MSPLIGIDEICDLKDKKKLLLCSFVLTNDPYNLKLELIEYQNLKCFQDKKNTLINMYGCPFAIEDENGKINEEIRYLISRGQDKTKAIIFRRDNPDSDLKVDAVVKGLVDIKQLKEMINAGLLSKEGRKYVSYHEDSVGEVDQMWIKYLEFLHSDGGKLKVCT